MPCNNCHHQSDTGFACTIAKLTKIQKGSTARGRGQRPIIAFCLGPEYRICTAGIDLGVYMDLAIFITIKWRKCQLGIHEQRHLKNSIKDIRGKNRQYHVRRETEKIRTSNTPGLLGFNNGRTTRLETERIISKHSMLKLFRVICCLC